MTPPKSQFNRFIRRATIGTMLAVIFFVIAAFCLDWRAGIFALAIASAFDAHISQSAAVQCKLEEMRNPPKP